MTLTVHKFHKVAYGEHYLFVFGDTFEAILDILKEFENLKEPFTDLGSNFSLKDKFLRVFWLF